MSFDECRKSGPHKIPFISELLSMLFNMSIQQHNVPSTRKKSFVIPFHKTKSKENIDI